MSSLSLQRSRDRIRRPAAATAAAAAAHAGRTSRSCAVAGRRLANQPGLSPRAYPEPLRAGRLGLLADRDTLRPVLQVAPGRRCGAAAVTVCRGERGLRPTAP